MIVIRGMEGVEYKEYELQMGPGPGCSYIPRVFRTI